MEWNGSGEIPDPVLQSTAITDNTSSRSSRNKREQSYMDSSNIIRSKRSIESNNCL
jgi:hypothetical protein